MKVGVRVGKKKKSTRRFNNNNTNNNNNNNNSSWTLTKLGTMPQDCTQSSTRVELWLLQGPTKQYQLACFKRLQNKQKK